MIGGIALNGLRWSANVPIIWSSALKTMNRPRRSTILPMNKVPS
jgi:hypothetical protein